LIEAFGGLQSAARFTTLTQSSHLHFPTSSHHNLSVAAFFDELLAKLLANLARALHSLEKREPKTDGIQ